ncbi:hypothetical protein AKG37_05880 [Bacillus australimaris]|uniref:Uncharacterized protein n=2 Tax=Bacillus TaxID=1386 RepID=A0ABD4QH39_9BACI|nr:MULTISPECIES: hypothetical protein [Bacillus]KPN14596.1 hypothetical protein AKG37_05880 [Bacillus australimaris]MBR8689749.1 hypothetical protein [Bacillus australimaris]MCC9088530.1 hypothetical protein [Bacillus pumilus]PIK26294.1 hypothetical protein CTV99_12830 [Bacillus pumilus]UUD42127.1 hypothetical protein NPA43_15145 [Bacillus pumilus]
MKIKKVLMAVALCLSLLTPIAVQAKDDPSKFTFEFKHQLTSRNWSLKGKNIKISTTSDTYGQKGSFKIELYRKTGWFSSKYVGVKSFTKEGTTTNVYSNKTSGDFYMIFKKAQSSVYTGGHGRITN